MTVNLLKRYRPSGLEKILAVKYLPHEEQPLMLRRRKKGAAHTKEWEAKLLIRAMGCIILVDAGISSSKTNTLR